MKNLGERPAKFCLNHKTTETRTIYLTDLIGCQHDDISALMKTLWGCQVTDPLREKEKHSNVVNVTAFGQLNSMWSMWQLLDNWTQCGECDSFWTTELNLASHGKYSKNPNPLTLNVNFEELITSTILKAAQLTSYPNICNCSQKRSGSIWQKELFEYSCNFKKSIPEILKQQTKQSPL